jgi:two-component system response regulator NreC
MMTIHVLLADDHQIVRQGLKGLLEREGFKVVGEAIDGREAVRLAGKNHPDVAVLDLVMPALNGVDAAREMLRSAPRLKAILLTMHTEDPYVLEALRAGVSGYVLKTQAADDLVQAIREVTRGSIYLSPGISRTVVDAYRSKTDLPPDPLSPREREVLQLVAEGKTTKEVAAILGISVKTAESHRTRIMSKLNIHETAGLVRYAIRRGLIEP